MLARAIVGSPATGNVRLPHRSARPTARPILISRTPPFEQFLPGRVVADAASVTSKSDGLVRCAFAVRREFDQVIAAAKSGIAPKPMPIGIGREFALGNQARAISSSVSRLR